MCRVESGGGVSRPFENARPTAISRGSNTTVRAAHPIYLPYIFIDTDARQAYRFSASASHSRRRALSPASQFIVSLTHESHFDEQADPTAAGPRVSREDIPSNRGRL